MATYYFTDDRVGVKINVEDNDIISNQPSKKKKKTREKSKKKATVTCRCGKNTYKVRGRLRLAIFYFAGMVERKRVSHLGGSRCNQTHSY